MATRDLVTGTIGKLVVDRFATASALSEQTEASLASSWRTVEAVFFRKLNAKGTNSPVWFLISPAGAVLFDIGTPSQSRRATGPKAGGATRLPARGKNVRGAAANGTATRGWPTTVTAV